MITVMICPARQLGTCKTERSEMSTYFVLKPEGKKPSEIFMHVKG